MTNLNRPPEGQLTSGTFEELYIQLKDAVAWLDSLGVRIPSTRIDAYQKTFADLMDVYRTGDEVRAKENLETYVNTLYEVHDIVEIHRGFIDADNLDYLTSRILDVSGGPKQYADENQSASNLARNTAFELLIASRLSAAGQHLIRHRLADIASIFDGKTVLFECKRPQSEKAIAKNIAIAYSQLRRRYATANNPRIRGVAAIDLTKALNPDLKTLAYDDPEEIGTKMGALIDACSETYKVAIRSCKQRKTIALLFRVCIMANPKRSGENIAYCQQFGINTFASSRESDKRIAFQVGQAIKGELGKVR